MGKLEKSIQRIDEYTTLTVSPHPNRAESDARVSDDSMGLTCGNCGSTDTDLIYWQSGGLSDRTVDLREVKCLACGYYSFYEHRDPL